MTRPLVLVPAYRLPRGRISRWDDGAVAVPDLYVQAMSRAGATAVLLPPSADHVPAEALSSFDGLLLIGGGDVDPSLYGAADHPTQYAVDAARDATETGLLREATRIGMPVLAVCRGAQVVNVAFGGTLLQHVPGVQGLIDHGRPDAGGPSTHDVKLESGSRIAAATGLERLSCSSHHHQGIDRVGTGLVPVGWADDGLVEALEGEEGWLVAVQWHPEDTAGEDRAQQALFDELSERASAFRAHRTGSS
jgi:gamma-glutamyl-gamma-aminobutyrate hydrolase PuuD